MNWTDRRILCQKAGITLTDAVLVRIPRAYRLIADHAVRLVKLDGNTKHFEVKSQTDPFTVYRVCFNGNPSAFCDCPDWRVHDLADAEQGIPFSLWHCKHSIAAKLAWALNRYHLDDFPNRPYLHITQRELLHRLNRDFGKGKWRVIGTQHKRFVRFRRGGRWHTAMFYITRQGNWYRIRTR